jgi:hypothetical protein
MYCTIAWRLSRKPATIFGQGTIPEPSPPHIGKGWQRWPRQQLSCTYIAQNPLDSRNDTQLLRNRGIGRLLEQQLYHRLVPILYGLRHRQIPPIIQILRVHPVEAQPTLQHQKSRSKARQGDPTSVRFQRLFPGLKGRLLECPRKLQQRPPSTASARVRASQARANPPPSTAADLGSTCPAVPSSPYPPLGAIDRPASPDHLFQPSWDGPRPAPDQTACT